MGAHARRAICPHHGLHCGARLQPPAVADLAPPPRRRLAGARQAPPSLHPGPQPARIYTEYFMPQLWADRQYGHFQSCRSSFGILLPMSRDGHLQFLCREGCNAVGEVLRCAGAGRRSPRWRGTPAPARTQSRPLSWQGDPRWPACMQTSASPAHRLPAILPDCQHKTQCSGYDGLRLVCSGSKQSSSASAPRSALVLSYLHISASSSKHSNILLSGELTFAIAAQRCSCMIAVQDTQWRAMGSSPSRRGGGRSTKMADRCARVALVSPAAREKSGPLQDAAHTPHRSPPPSPEACEHSTALLEVSSDAHMVLVGTSA